MKKENINDLSTEFMSDIGTGFQRAFKLIDFAEDEIEKAKKTNPNKIDLIDSCFKHLCPPPILSEAPEKLFRAHCAELIKRVITGKDLKPATSAELLTALKEMSLKVSVSRTTFIVYQLHFSKIFPEESAEFEMVKLNCDEKQKVKRYEKELRKFFAHPRIF